MTEGFYEALTDSAADWAAEQRGDLAPFDPFADDGHWPWSDDDDDDDEED